MASGATMKTVATAVGVSPSTVSNAYNKPEQLSAELRERIFAAARELGYPGPDAAARSLRSRRAGAIGLLFTEQLSYAFSDPYSVGMLAGLSEVVERSRTGLLLIPLAGRWEGRDGAWENEAETVRSAVVDGVVAYCVDEEHPALAVLAQRGLPVVAANDGPGGRRVVIDDRGAARSVGEHLLRLGHRSITVVADVPGGGIAHQVEHDSELHHDGALRVAGVRDALATFGGETRLTVFGGGHNSRESGMALAEAVLDSRDRPTAIVAVSDVMAFGVLDAMRQRGIQPGRDISATGFDDVPAAAAAGLTTIRQPIRERGRLLGRMLLDPDYTEERVVLPTELVVRSTTGPAPS